MAVEQWIKDMAFAIWKADGTNGNTLKTIIDGIKLHVGKAGIIELKTEFAAWERIDLLATAQPLFDEGKEVKLDNLVIQILDNLEVTKLALQQWLFSKLRPGRQWPVPPPEPPPE